MTLFEAIILTIITASTPLLIAAIGELVVERAGVLNLGVEGMMIIGAAAGIAAAITTGSSTLGVLVAVLAGMALSLVFAALVLGLAANQVAAGLALAILGLGLSGVIGAPFVGVQRAGIGKIEIPWLSDVPFIGPLLFRQDPFVYASVAGLSCARSAKTTRRRMPWAIRCGAYACLPSCLAAAAPAWRGPICRSSIPPSGPAG